MSGMMGSLSLAAAAAAVMFNLLVVRHCARSFTCIIIIADASKTAIEVTVLAPVCRCKNCRKRSGVAFLRRARPRFELHSLISGPMRSMLGFISLP